MSWYRLLFGGVTLGDELILPLSTWRATAKVGSSPGSGNLEPIVKVDARPLGLVLYPRFRIRKMAASLLEFEEWVFDLASWANGDPRYLVVADQSNATKAVYGECKLLALDRPQASDASAGRWCDQVVLTFQSDTIPVFYS